MDNYKSLERLSVPSTRPVTPADLRTQLDLPCDGNSTQDELDCIDASIDQVEKYVGRDYSTQTWRKTYDAFPCEFRLDGPIVGTPVITYIDSDGVTQTLATNQYQVDSYSVPARIKPAFNVSWPVTRPDTYNAVQVTWTAGATPSAKVKRAILMLAADLFINRVAQDEVTLNPNKRVWQMLDQERTSWL